MYIRPIIITLCMLMSMPVAASAQTAGQEETKEQKKSYLYEWTDEKGIVHIDDRLEMVPDKYRQKVRKIEKQGGTQAPVTQQAPETIQTPQQPFTDEQLEQVRKQEWQSRIIGWKEKLEAAEKRYRDLEQKRNDLLMKWGSSALAPLGTQQEARQVEEDMKNAQRDIDEARRMLDVVIPDEARKAGVPPGWLRVEEN